MSTTPASEYTDEEMTQMALAADKECCSRGSKPWCRAFLAALPARPAAQSAEEGPGTLAEDLAIYPDLKRWNFEADGEGILYCSGDHEKSAGCSYCRMSHKEAVTLIEHLRKQISPPHPAAWPGQQEAIDKAFEKVHRLSLTATPGHSDWAVQEQDRLTVAQAYEAARPAAAEIARLKAELEKAQNIIRLLTDNPPNVVHVIPGNDPTVEKLKAELKKVRKHLEDANRGAERNAKINSSLAGKLNTAQAELADSKRKLADSKRKLAYAEEHLGILAKTFGYEGRTWCNMVSYLAPRLQKAESSLEKAQAELAALKEERDELNKDLSALLRVLDSHDATEGVETARHLKAELASLREPALRQPLLADDGRSLGQVALGACVKADEEGLALDKCHEAAAQAVAAVVLAQAIRRMEAVPKSELQFTGVDNIRARLLQAAKGRGEAQPQAVAVNEQALDEGQPDLSGESEKQAQPWTPAVGDTVRLKSGGPVMTVFALDGSNVWCRWNTWCRGPIWPVINGESFPAACLTPATP